jgi:hypothetical protein
MIASVGVDEQLGKAPSRLRPPICCLVSQIPSGRAITKLAAVKDCSDHSSEPARTANVYARSPLHLSR